MKTLKTFLFLLLTFFTISCSKKDEDTIIPNSAFSVENNKEYAIADAGNYIPIVPGTIESVINIPNQGLILNTEKVSIQLDIQYNKASAIIAILTAPNGNQYTLLYRTGLFSKFIAGNKLNFNTKYTNFLKLSSSQVDIIAGNYYPSANNIDTFDAINTINNGFTLNDFLTQKNISGDWKLKVSDNEAGFVGKLIAWKLIFEDGWDR